MEPVAGAEGAQTEQETPPSKEPVERGTKRRSKLASLLRPGKRGSKLKKVRKGKSLFARGAKREDQYDVRPDEAQAGPDRIIWANSPERNAEQYFCDNVVITSKYNMLTFLPLFLFNQFKRIANVYFLILSVLQLIPGLSPTGTFTTLLVLIFVLFINALKEVWEDVKRHRDDSIVNQRLVSVLRNGRLVLVEWAELQVGDLCRLQHKDNVPADCLLLWSSEEQGVVYVETSSLDGETNLKRKSALPETQQLFSGAEGAMAKMVAWRGCVKAEFPHRFISSLGGTLSCAGSESPDDHVPYDEEQMLLRGSSVRNTKGCWVMAIYTGFDTKLVLNSKRPPFKRTNVELKTNRYIFAVFGLLIVVSLGCAVGSGIYLGAQDFGQAPYLAQQSLSPAGQAALNFLTFFILFGQMIPISLYTSMEIVRLFQGFFMQNDLMLYYEKNDVPMVARSTTLNEELGQVAMIFSDKTGTLTQNQMQFRKCVVEGTVYGRGYTEIGLLNARRRGEPIDEALVTDELVPLLDPFVNFDDPTLLEHLAVGDARSQTIHEFLLALAVCHTIVPETDEDGELEYQASSPDEMALVRAAKSLGYFFNSRTGRSVGVSINGVPYSCEVINVLEFDSDRKRMSVIVADSTTHKYALYCKGADAVIEGRLATGSPHLKETSAHLELLGSEGLRTLMVAARELEPDYYKGWAQRYEEASRIVEGSKRKKAQDVLSDEIENDLRLLGATAIEDKLQVGVPDAIAQLQRANLSIFILTGDKQETAINIGYACSLLHEDMERMILNVSPPPPPGADAGGSLKDMKLTAEQRDAACRKLTEELLDKFIENTDGASDSNEQLALIVNGFTLRYALDDEFGLSDKFLQLSRRCKSVICCRVSPAQKAQVVGLHKKQLGRITLAIGDGANDVAMIQAAHVGVGINGEEGLQAVRSSDYAIAQFRFLVPLLLIHGRYSYRRVTKLIMYFFFKNVCFVMTQFWYAIFNQFTGQSLYEQWTLALYNVVFTSVPIVVFAVMDEDVSRKTVLANPQLYRDGQDNHLFTLPMFIRWVINGIWMSCVVFFMAYGTLGSDTMAANGMGVGLWLMGYEVYTGMVLSINLRLAMEIKKWDWTLHVSLWGSILAWFVWGLAYGAIWPKLPLGSEMYWVPYTAFSLSSYWLALLLMVVLSMLVTFTGTYINRTYWPEDYHIIQEQDVMRRNITLPELTKVESQLLAPKPLSHSKYSGFAFAPGDEASLRNSVRQPTKEAEGHFSEAAALPDFVVERQ